MNIVFLIKHFDGIIVNKLDKSKADKHLFSLFPLLSLYLLPHGVSLFSLFLFCTQSETRDQVTSVKTHVTKWRQWWNTLSRDVKDKWSYGVSDESRYHVTSCNDDRRTVSV